MYPDVSDYGPTRMPDRRRGGTTHEPGVHDTPALLRQRKTRRGHPQEDRGKGGWLVTIKASACNGVMIGGEGPTACLPLLLLVA